VNGDKPLILFGNTTLTYRQLDVLTNKVANAFASRGIKRGDRAVVLMWNDPWTWIVWLGLVKLACWVAFINPHYKGQSLDYLIGRIDPRVLVAHSNVVDEVLGTPSGQAITIKILQELPGQPRAQHAGMLNLAELTEHASDDAVALEIAPDDIAGMVHTSGTTGMPKFCLLSHNYYFMQGMIQVRKMAALPSDRF